MAVRPHMGCTACGATRLVTKFDPEIQYEPRYSVQHLNGGRSCRWEHTDLPLDMAKLQQQRLRAVLARLDAMIAEAERG